MNDKQNKFTRQFNEDLIIKLKKHPLFKKLLPDIENGKVFPALRDNLIDFYYKGGRLFTFNKKGFKTHIKYASVYKSTKNYISESELENAEKIKHFEDGYERIKENCSLYSGDEAEGVSAIYHKHSYAVDRLNKVVLDIEVSFKSQDPNKKQDRIDILLFDKEKKKLMFCEAKHYSNSEIWAKERNTPKVITQIKKYEDQIINKRPDILLQYKKYRDAVNSLFPLKLPYPEGIANNVLLIVFGFDGDQLEGRFTKLFKENDNIFKRLKYYPIGNVSSLNLENVYKKCKL